MSSASTIHDNRSRAMAGDFLKRHIRFQSELSFVSAYFTIHAYAARKENLESAAKLRFLFGDPRSVSSLDKDDKQARRFTLGPDSQSLELGNQLRQKQIARECAAWIRRQVEIRTIEKINTLEERIAEFDLHVENHPEIDWDNRAPDESEDPDEETKDFTIGGRRRIHLAHLKLEEWLQAVRHDRTQLQYLYEKTEKVKPERDAKLAELRQRIQEKVTHPSINKDGVVPPPDNVRPRVQPGALFCLRRASQAEKRSATGEKLNPLAPHFLLYVHDDGVVRYTFAQPKETLNLLRSLAAGHPNAFRILCDQFDGATQGGADMSLYSDLIASALRTIETTFQKRATASLLSGRDGLLPTPDESARADDGDWELVTWLIVLASGTSRP